MYSNHYNCLSAMRDHPNMHAFYFLFLCIGLLLPASLQASVKPKIVIIIDDIGYHKNDLKLVELPFQLTYAILPHTPYGNQAARLAAEHDKDVMLHMPMEAVNGKTLGPGGLTKGMTRQQVEHTLKTALQDIPHVIGMNNHMGSLFTELDKPMAWTIEFLQQQRLFFLDSLTTPHSKGTFYARKFGVTSLKRDVFLDNVPAENELQQQFSQLIAIAQKRDYAIAIAHPYPETYRFLQKKLPELTELGIELVRISELLPQSKGSKHQHALQQ